MRRPSPGGLAGPALRRGVWLTSVAGAVALAAVAALARDGEPPLAALALMDGQYLALSVLLTVAAWWLRVVRSGILVRALGVRVPAGRMFAYYLSSVFVSHVTPTSTGGVPLFIYWLTREGLSVGRATAVAVIDSGLVALWLLAGWPVAGVLVGWGARNLQGWTAAALAALALVAALAAWIVARPRDLAGLTLSLRRRLAPKQGGTKPARLLLRASREALRFAVALRLFVLDRPLALGAAVLLTGLYWATYLSIAWAVVQGLGGRGDWTTVAVRQLAFNLAQAFIPTPGGSGGAELMMAYLLRDLLTPTRLAVAVGVWRLCTFYSSLAVGGLALVRLLRSTFGGPSANLSTPSPVGKVSGG